MFARLYHYIPNKITRPFIPPRWALYNRAQSRFALAVGTDVHVSARLVILIF